MTFDLKESNRDQPSPLVASGSNPRTRGRDWHRVPPLRGIVADEEKGPSWGYRSPIASSGSSVVTKLPASEVLIYKRGNTLDFSFPIYVQ